MNALTLHSGDRVLVHTDRSHYDGVDGRVMSPEPEGGFVVALDGGWRCHFEPSELEFLGRPQIEAPELLDAMDAERSVSAA